MRDMGIDGSSPACVPRKGVPWFTGLMRGGKEIAFEACSSGVVHGWWLSVFTWELGMWCLLSLSVNEA